MAAHWAVKLWMSMSRTVAFLTVWSAVQKEFERDSVPVLELESELLDRERNWEGGRVHRSAEEMEMLDPERKGDGGRIVWPSRSCCISGGRAEAESSDDLN
jgi:hypothetical protein